MASGREVDAKLLGLHILSNCKTVQDAIAQTTHTFDAMRSQWMQKYTDAQVREDAVRARITDFKNQSPITSERERLEKDLADLQKNSKSILEEVVRKIDEVQGKMADVIKSRC
jgi:hypothetical protein